VFPCFPVRVNGYFPEVQTDLSMGEPDQQMIASFIIYMHIEKRLAVRKALFNDGE